MRKFALLPLIFGLVGFGSAQAQVRDLFAEFEQEAASSAVETPVPASSAAKAEAPVPASSAATAKTTEAPATSSSFVPPASSAVVSSSSLVSSSVPPASSAPVSSSVTPASSAAVSSSSSLVSSSVTPASSSVVSDSVSKDSSAAAQPVASDSAAIAKDSSKTADSSAVKPDSLTPMQAYAEKMKAHVDSVHAHDSLVAASSSSALNLSSSSMSRRDLLGPVKVSKVHSIDEMKGKYKSPRKALFLSLVIPGSGQLYVGGSKFTYARGVVYLAIEAGLWAGWYYKTIYEYNKQVDKYKDFANKHYSIGRYENGMYDLFTALPDEDVQSRFVDRYMNSRESFCEALYGNAGARGCYTSNKLPYEEETTHKTAFGDNPKSLGKESKDGFSESSEVYQMIGGASFVLGWDDVDDVAVSKSLDLEDPNSETVSLGSSKNRDKYRSMRRDANDLANMQAWFIGGLILNHLVSAVDAAFTANSHNKSLYEEDLSWYDYLHFDSGVSFLNGFGVDVRASWGF